MTNTEFITSPEKYYQIVCDPTNEMKQIRIVRGAVENEDGEFEDEDEAMMLVSYSREIEFAETLGSTSIITACFTTAWARLRLHRVLVRLGPRAKYYDTGLFFSSFYFQKCFNF